MCVFCTLLLGMTVSAAMCVLARASGEAIKHGDGKAKERYGGKDDGQ